MSGKQNSLANILTALNPSTQGEIPPQKNNKENQPNRNQSQPPPDPQVAFLADGPWMNSQLANAGRARAPAATWRAGSVLAPP